MPCAVPRMNKGERRPYGKVGAVLIVLPDSPAPAGEVACYSRVYGIQTMSRTLLDQLRAPRIAEEDEAAAAILKELSQVTGDSYTVRKRLPSQ